MSSMIKPISHIVWPESRKDSTRLLLSYMTSVLSEIGIRFPNDLHNPVNLSSNSDVGAELCRDSELHYWWGIVDAEGVRNFQSELALTARLAICMLSVREDDALPLGEQLSWFIEVLGLGGKGQAVAVKMLPVFFNFSESKTGVRSE